MVQGSWLMVQGTYGSWFMVKGSFMVNDSRFMINGQLWFKIHD